MKYYDMPKKHKYLIVIISMVSHAIILGQNYFVSNLYNNLVFSNPSFAVANDFSWIQLNYRNQWPVDGIFNTYGVAYFHDAEDLHSNFGAVFNYDRQLKGVYNTYALGANYAFQMQTGRRSYLLLGLSGSYNFQYLNYSNVNFAPSAPVPENQARNYPLINSGISFLYNETHLIGVSVVNIYPFVTNPLVDRTIHISYIGNIEPRRPTRSSISYIQPVANIRWSNYKFEFLYGGNVGIHNFKAGLLLNQTMRSINSAAILLGISFKNYEFIYSYDINLSTSVSINPKMVAHEVTFLNKFQYNGRRKRRGAIKCPDIQL